MAEALELTQLTGFEKRKPAQMSGGQQQRVALARALVNRPRALLLDEPLGALDLRLRKQLQLELKRIQQEVGITFIHVTHDQEEAMALADTIAVMNEGRIEQAGQRARPVRAPVHRVRRQLPRRLQPDRPARSATATARGPSSRPTTARACALPLERLNGQTVGASMMCGVRPEKVGCCPADVRGARTALNVLRGRVEIASFLGIVDPVRGPHAPAARS